MGLRTAVRDAVRRSDRRRELKALVGHETGYKATPAARRHYSNKIVSANLDAMIDDAMIDRLGNWEYAYPCE